MKLEFIFILLIFYFDREFKSELESISYNTIIVLDDELKKRGFQKSSNLLDKIMEKSIKKRGFLHHGLFSRWREIIGQELCDKVIPVKLSSSKLKNGATLTLQVNGSYGPEIQLMLELIKEKINAVYGYAAIGRISLVQVQSQNKNQNALLESLELKRSVQKNLKDLLDPQVIKNIHNIVNEDLRTQLELLGRNIIEKKLDTVEK